MQSICDNNELLVVIRRYKDWEPGLSFETSDGDFLQVGTWLYDAGKMLDRHHHNILERFTNITQECIIVLSGSLRTNVYSTKNEFVCSFDLEQGDYAVFLRGGHSYEILENGTRVVEVKNGPFLGVELDKTRF